MGNGQWPAAGEGLASLKRLDRGKERLEKHFKPLGNRPDTDWKAKFITIWAGETVSFTTSCMLQLVIIWYLTEITGSAMILALATMAGFLPQAVFGTPIGVFIDRHNRKLIMIAADIFIAFVGGAFALVCLLSSPPIWFIMLCLFLRSVGTAFHSPSLNSITPLIVPKEHLMRCTGYTQSVMSASYVFSPALGAAAYAFFGLSAVALFDIVGAIVASCATGLVKIPNIVNPAEEKHMFREIKEGFRALRVEPGLFNLLWIGMLFMIAIMPINALFPLICMDYFGGGFKEASAAETSFAVGMVLGGVVLGKTGGTKRRVFMLTGSIFVSGAICAIAGLLPRSAFYWFLAVNIPWGFVAPFHIAVQTTLLQERIKPEVLGRVFALSGSLTSLSMPVGLLLSGFFAGVTGVDIWFVITGVVILAIGALTLAIPSVKAL